MLTLDDMQVVYAFITIIAILIAGIYLYRWYAHRKSRNSLSPLQRCKPSSRTKYSQLDFLRHRSQRLGIGLVSSLLIAVVAMSWTTYERSSYDDGGVIIEEDEIEVVPRTDQQPPKPVPPPPPQVIEEIEEELIEEDQPELLDTEVEVDDFVEEVPFEEGPSVPTPPPPLPLPEAPDDGIEEIFDFVQQKPLFGGCEDDACSVKELMKYLGTHIKYPNIARENNIKGRVTAQFVVERDGTISDISILRGIGGGCDEEVSRVLKKMNEKILWKPGLQNGKEVRVRYRLPVTFKPIN